MTVGNDYNEKEKLIIGTHNGIFHADEVVAIAILNLLYNGYKDIHVIRSRDLKLLRNKCNILVDIGGGNFDHHQKGGNGQRENGIKYASSGLVWREFGKQLIHKLDSSVGSEDIDRIWNITDNMLIQEVDMEDNGQGLNVHPFNYITNFLPKWNEENKDYDKNFEECLAITSSILENEIRKTISDILSEKYMNEKLENLSGNILEIPGQTFPWLSLVTNANEEGADIDFVIFKYPAGGYAVQCVPKSYNDKFSQRIPFPEEWAGEKENLPEISGLKSATFCHNGRFFATALEKEDALNMCDIATRKHMENISKQYKS